MLQCGHRRGARVSETLGLFLPQYIQWMSLAAGKNRLPICQIYRGEKDGILLTDVWSWPHLDSGAWGSFSQPRHGIKKTRLFNKGSFGDPEATTVPGRVVTRSFNHISLRNFSITLTCTVWSKDCAYGDSRVLPLTNPYLLKKSLSNWFLDNVLQVFLHLYDWILLLRVWRRLRQVLVGIWVALLRLRRGM